MNRIICFKELNNEIVKHIHNIDIIKNIKDKYLLEKIDNLNIDKKNINKLLFDLKDSDEEIFIEENNLEFIKNKINECILYLNIFEKILENNDEKNKVYLNIENEDDYNNISYILSLLQPILDDKEIIGEINKDIIKDRSG